MLRFVGKSTVSRLRRAYAFKIFAVEKFLKKIEVL